MYGPYGQEDHDRADEVGCQALIVGLIVAAIVIAAIVAGIGATETNEERKMDGSHAGANAVTADDIERGYEHSRARPTNCG